MAIRVPAAFGPLLILASSSLSGGCIITVEMPEQSTHADAAVIDAGLSDDAADTDGASGDVAVGDSAPAVDAEYADAATDAGVADGASDCEALFATFDTILAEQTAAQERGGGSVAGVVTPECGLWVGAVGDAEPGVPLTSNRLLRAGSITKTYTAATVLMLESEGALSIGDTLDQYIAGFANGDRITLRHLLNHTSGLYDITDDTAFMQEARQDPSRVYTPAELLQVSIDNGPVFEPGTQFSYCNTNYIALGVVIARATGQSALQAIRQRLLAPHGLDRTYLEGAEPLPEALVPAYSTAGQDITHVLPPSIRRTAGAMVVEIADLTQFFSTLGRGQLLPPAQLNSMLQGVATGSPDSEYGLGLTLLTQPETGLVIGHSGATPGQLSLAQHAVSLDVTAAAIVNSAGGQAKPIVDELLAAAASPGE